MSYSDIFSCKGKVVLVTGGSGLMGRIIAKALNDFGSTVYIADVDRKGVDEIIDGTEIRFIALDITAEESVNGCMEDVLQENGRIDVLINSTYPRTDDWGLHFESIPFDSWKKNVDDHLGGYFLVCQKVAEQMKRQGGGSIINIASIYGVVAPDFSIYEGTDMTMPAAYSAIKGGLITFTKYLATYYARDKIRANTISPGGIFDGQDAAFVERYSKKTPLGRMGNPEDIIGAVIYLASDASSYVTGQNLLVDGGWTAW